MKTTNSNTRPLEFYTYSTPKVRIYWNGHMQPKAFLSAVEAKQWIEAYAGNVGTFQIKAEGITVLELKYNF